MSEHIIPEGLLTEDEKAEIDDLDDYEIRDLANMPVQVWEGYTNLQGQRILYARYLVDNQIIRPLPN